MKQLRIGTHPEPARDAGCSSPDNAVALERAMQQLSVTGARMGQAAAVLHDQAVRPVIEQLRDRFDNATTGHYRTPAGFLSECRLVHTPESPAAGRIEIALKWNAGTGAAWLCCEADVTPALMPFERSDYRDIGLTSPGSLEARHWVQGKLLAFESFYRDVVQSSSAYRTGDARTDPVCGMPVPRRSAHQVSYQGLTFWLCSDACRDVFEAEPALYVVGRIPLTVLNPRRTGPETAVRPSSAG